LVKRFVVYDDTALLAAVLGVLLRREHLEVIVPYSAGLIAFGAIPPLQFVGIDGQMAAAAAQALALFRQQGQVLMAASGHIIGLLFGTI
jgi:hypothetical protein